MESDDPNMASRRLPNFIVLGTYRAGTTWLHESLRENPRIIPPSEKELMYFSHNYEKGLDWYSSFFRQGHLDSVIGEVCPTYFSDKKSPARIRETLGRIKLSVILRRPTEQIASMHQLWLRRGKTQESLEAALISHPWLIENVMYASHLENYERVFGEGSVKVFLYDDLAADPIKFIENFYSWLDLAAFYPPFINERKNATAQMRAPQLEMLLARGGEMLRAKNLLRLKSIINRSGTVRFIRQKNEKSAKIAPITQKEKHIISENTLEDRIMLSTKIGIDLRNWV